MSETTYTIEKLYTKDISMEVPNAPYVYQLQDNQVVDMRVETSSKHVGDNFYEASVSVTLTAKEQPQVQTNPRVPVPEPAVIFLCEITQSGIFKFENVDEKDMPVLLHIACPNLLFPYLREAVSSTVTRAGFAPVMLAPINFEAVYNNAISAKPEPKPDENQSEQPLEEPASIFNDTVEAISNQHKQ